MTSTPPRFASMFGQEPLPDRPKGPRFGTMQAAMETIGTEMPQGWGEWLSLIHI